MADTATVISETTQYLTFKLAEEIFAVDVARIREILEVPVITRIPRMPESMIGVINVRGSVVPVVDLRLRFGMEKMEKTVDTCIVVMEVAIEGETLVLGAVADSVDEVIEQQPDQVEPPPRIGTKIDMEFIKGMGKRDDNFIIILDIDRVFTKDELNLVKETKNA